MEFLFIFLCLLTGFISGACAGFFGIGGGVINVPFLIAIFYFFPEPGDMIKKSIVSSLAVVFITSLSSSYTHFKSNKDLLLRNLFITGFAGGTGAILGAHIAISIKSIYLQKALGILEIFAGFYILFQRERENGEKKPALHLLGIFAFLAGIFSATFGIGGGVVFIPLTRLFTNYPLTHIIGYSSGIIPFVSFFGLSQYLWVELSKGEKFLSLPAVIPMSITSIIGARLGAKWVYFLNKEKLKVFYFIFLLIIGCILIY